ncbi:MAG: NUDIX hydrolase [Candidatus Rokuibacteriota bacterium]
MGVTETVRAAGGVVWRRTANGEADILLVHRVGRQDWTLPKGKVEPGETEEACAVREVREETSLSCTLGVEVGTVRYRDQRGREKTVRYWSMEVVDGVAAPQHEVDAVRWIPLGEATAELTYPRDRALLASCTRQIVQSVNETPN